MSRQTLIPWAKPDFWGDEQKYVIEALTSTRPSVLLGSGLRLRVQLRNIARRSEKSRSRSDPTGRSEGWVSVMA